MSDCNYKSSGDSGCLAVILLLVLVFSGPCNTRNIERKVDALQIEMKLHREASEANNGKFPPDKGA